MAWFIFNHIFSTILSIINITRLSNQEKDLEILILCQQLSILQRKHNSLIRSHLVEKMTLALLTARLKRITHRSANQMRDVIRIFQNVIHTPFQSPKANSFAERWVRSVREECLDHILIINQNHLHRILKEYVNYYNHHRPHQGIQQQFPISGSRHNRYGLVRRHNILGGIIHGYYRQPYSST